MTNWTAIAPKPQKISRFTDPITGLRFYSIPGPNGGELAVPGMTSLLSYVAPQSDKDRLERWRAKEIAAGRDPSAAALRGSMAHECCERMLRGLDPEYPNETIAEFCQGMVKPLQNFDAHIWSERPLISGADHCWNTSDKGNPERLARVWSYELGCAGTPDYVGRRGDRYCLVDLKTAKAPYYVPEPGVRVPYGEAFNFKKYKKTVRQIIGYSICIKETLGIEISEYEIIVGLSGDRPAQHIVIPQRDIEQETQTVRRLAAQFWSDYQWAKETEEETRLIAA